MRLDDSILTYEQAYNAGIKEVGTKAFNIASCSMAGFRVPEGIVLPMQVFLSNLAGNNLERIFQEIERYFPDVKNLIVRSSSLCEDSAETSYAGQYLSLVCLNYAKEIKQACEVCWASHSSAQATAYHKAFNEIIAPENHKMGLLIQRMVNAHSAGVCFTRDPLMNREGIFVINAVHGHCEALVSGEVVAEQYSFDYNQKKIFERYIGKQSFWRAPENPQKLAPLPPELRNIKVLNSLQIDKISQVALKSATLFGSPQDIEWAYEGEKLFLLQSRPITRATKNDAYELWTRDNVADVIPDAITPLTWSIVNHATNNGFKKVVRRLKRSYIPTNLFDVFDGRVYFNQFEYKRMLTLNLRKYQIPVFLLKTAINYVFLVFTVKREIASLENTFKQELTEFSVSHGGSAISDLVNYLNKYMVIHIQVGVLMDIGFHVIRKLIKKHVPENEVSSLVDGLVTGLKKIESTASGESLWEIARSIKNNKQLSDEISSSRVQLIPKILERWGGDYWKDWREFLINYGHSSLKEFEIYYPRWSEDQSFILTILKHYVSEADDIDPKVGDKIRGEKKIESERKLLKYTPFLYYFPLKLYIDHTRQCSIRREALKQKIVMIMGAIRKQALAFSGKYEIIPAENVFFLTLDEINHSKGNSISPKLFKKISARKDNWRKWNDQKPFKEIRVYADGRQVKVPYFAGTGNQLHGLALSSGQYTGPAKIILDTAQIDSFNFGDVLVTHSINPSWTPLFRLAGAIVTDMGNYLSHGAIVAREMGIPAVGNVFTASKELKSGEMIYIDGDRGIVRKI